MNEEKLKIILKKHQNWLWQKGGEKADLTGADLRGVNLRETSLRDANLTWADLADANLRGADLRNTDLRSANLTNANLRVADLTNANLSNANLTDANLRDANLTGANLRGINLTDADLTWADFRGANLRGANLARTNLYDVCFAGANLRGAYFYGADLSEADLRGADLRNTDFSQSKGVLSPSEWLASNFESTDKGYIVYKTFGEYNPSPSSWKIENDSIIEEVCNFERVYGCACGINFATLNWIYENTLSPNTCIWKCLIPWKDLPSVVIPYNTDGKARCERLILLEKLEVK